jgi:hypothetical protein
MLYKTISVPTSLNICEMCIVLLNDKKILQVPEIFQWGEISKQPKEHKRDRLNVFK